MLKKLFLFLLIPALAFAAEPKANKIRTDTSTFNNNLGAGDSTVQAALDTLDNMTAGGAGTGVQEVTATLPVVSSGGTRPAISLQVDNSTIGTNASQQLIVNPGGITTTQIGSGAVALATQVSGSIPAASLGLIEDANINDNITLSNITQITARSITSLTGTLPEAALGVIPLTIAHVSGTLPIANIPLIPADTKLSGTIAASNLGIVDLATQAGGTIPAANLGIVALGTQVGGTIPAANLGIILDASVSDTLTASNLVTGSSVVSDAEVDDNITLTNITQITTRAITSLTGTLATAALGVIPLGDTEHISGTVPIASIPIIPANTKLSGTIAAENLGMVALGTQASGTLPDAASPLRTIAGLTGAYQTLRFGTGLDNILPAGTGATNQILKLSAPGTLDWAADADSGGGSGAPTDPVYFLEVAVAELPNAKTTIPVANLAVIPLATQVSGTLPIASVPLIPADTKLSGTIAAANLGLVAAETQISGTLPIANIPLIPANNKLSGTIAAANLGLVALATQTSGTVPIASVPFIPANTNLTGTIAAANLGLVNLTSQVSGTLPIASVAKIPANTHLTGTIAAANLGLVAANTQLSGTIAAANLGIVALGTQVSGTLPGGSFGTSPGAGIGIGVTYGASLKINNLGVTSIIGGLGVGVTSGQASTINIKTVDGIGIGTTLAAGQVTINNKGVTSIIAGLGIGVTSGSAATISYVAGQTEPLMCFNIKSIPAGDSIVQKMLSPVWNYKLSYANAVTKTAPTLVNYYLHVIGTSGTGAGSALSSGTAPGVATAIQTAFGANDTIPAGQFLRVTFGTTGASSELHIFGQRY